MAKITIIGGNGQMGGLFSRLLAQLGHTINQIGSQDWDSAPPILAASDLVIVCVPINLTKQIINRVSQHLKPDCVLADFTSIKVDPLLAMLSDHPGPVLGLHPMFGPSITTTQSQVIICCDGRGASNYAWLIADLTQLGFTLKNMSANEHDQAMSFIQGIEHFLTFSLGTFLRQKQQHPERLLEIASPIYLAKLFLMGRIFDQDPKLYADIIMADRARIALISEFSTWLQHWVSQLEQENKPQFIAEFSATSKWMGEFTSKSQRLSDDFLNLNLPNNNSKSVFAK